VAGRTVALEPCGESSAQAMVPLLRAPCAVDGEQAVRPSGVAAGRREREKVLVDKQEPLLEFYTRRSNR
jgi:hypothetical protein